MAGILLSQEVTEALFNSGAAVHCSSARAVLVKHQVSKLKDKISWPPMRGCARAVMLNEHCSSHTDVYIRKQDLYKHRGGLDLMCRHSLYVVNLGGLM